jgi:hypothetical protein
MTPIANSKHSLSLGQINKISHWNSVCLTYFTDFKKQLRGPYEVRKAERLNNASDADTDMAKIWNYQRGDF